MFKNDLDDLRCFDNLIKELVSVHCLSFNPWTFGALFLIALLTLQAIGVPARNVCHRALKCFFTMLTHNGLFYVLQFSLNAFP